MDHFNMSELIRFRKDVKITFIDCETLNLCLNYCHNLPWQISMLDVVGEEIVDEADLFVKWDTNLQISDDAARITRYNPAVIVEKGIAPEKAFEVVYPWLEKCEYILGHNTLGFDIYLIYHLYKKFNKDPRHLISKFIDTNAIMKGLKLNIPYNKKDDFIEYQYRMMSIRQKGLKTNLKLTAEEHDIQFDENKLHDGLYDLFVNKQVWDKVKYKIEI